MLNRSILRSVMVVPAICAASNSPRMNWLFDPVGGHGTRRKVAALTPIPAAPIRTVLDGGHVRGPRCRRER